MHEYSVELYDNFVVKPKQSLAQPIQIFVFRRFSDDFRSIIGRNRFKFQTTTYDNTNAVDRKRKWISYITYVIQGHNRCAQ